MIICKKTMANFTLHYSFYVKNKSVGIAFHVKNVGIAM